MELWNPQTRYRTGDVVFFQGGTYQALEPNSGSFIPRGLQPGSAGAFAFWQLIGGTPFVQTVFTNAQILALPGNGSSVPGPVIIPAQGPGKIVVPITQYFHLKWVANYTNINATAVFGIQPLTGTLFFDLLTENTGVPGTTVSTLLASGANSDVLSVASQLFLVGSPTPTQAQSIAGYGALSDNTDHVFVFDNSGSGHLTGGNVGNGLVINVTYQVFDVSGA